MTKTDVYLGLGWPYEVRYGKENEFNGAEFRDEKSKLLYVYDYENKYTLRIWGANIKPLLYRECHGMAGGCRVYHDGKVHPLAWRFHVPHVWYRQSG